MKAISDYDCNILVGKLPNLLTKVNANSTKDLNDLSQVWRIVKKLKRNLDNTQHK